MKSEYDKSKRLELMGELVAVSYVFRRHFSRKGNVRHVEWVSEPYNHLPRCRAGWIVGFSYRYNGKIKLSSNYGGRYETPTFKRKSTVPVVEVCFWPHLNPVPVPKNGFTRGTDLEPMSPSKWDWYTWEIENPEAVETEKQFLRNVARNIPRDDKGRFT